MVKSSVPNLDSLRPAEKDALLEYLLYIMPQEVRHKLATVFPDSYNKICGNKLVTAKFDWQWENELQAEHVKVKDEKHAEKGEAKNADDA